MQIAVLFQHGFIVRGRQETNVRLSLGMIRIVSTGSIAVLEDLVLGTIREPVQVLIERWRVRALEHLLTQSNVLSAEHPRFSSHKANNEKGQLTLFLSAWYQ